MPGGHTVVGGAVVDVTNLLGAVALLVIGTPLAVAVLLMARRGLKRVEMGIGTAHLGLEAMSAEFKPNGGSTLRDAVDRIERTVSTIDERLTAVEEAVTTPTTKEG